MAATGTIQAFRNTVTAPPSLYNSLLLALAVLGYPLASVLVTLLQVDSQAITLPYRAFFIAITSITAAAMLFRRRAATVDLVVVMFGLVYVVRLLIDYGAVLDEFRSYILIYFVGATFLPALALAIIGIDRVEDRKLAYCLIGGGIILVLGSFLQTGGPAEFNDPSLGAGRFSLDALNPISLGHAAGSAALAAIWLLIATRPTLIGRALLAAAILLFLYILIIAASRGPLVALVLGVAMLFVTRIQRFIILGPAVIVALAIFLPGTTLYERLLDTQRYTNFTDENTLLRLEYQAAALEQFADNPLFGSTATLVDYGPLAYPHNFLIEAAMALGIIGIVLMGWALLKSAIRLLGGVATTHPLVSLLFVQYFLASCFSGAIWGNAPFLALLFLVASARSSRQMTFQETDAIAERLQHQSPARTGAATR